MGQTLVRTSSLILSAAALLPCDTGQDGSMT